MRIRPRCRVELAYRLFDEADELVETSDEEGPLSFVVGEGEMPEALEQALLDREVGERLRVELGPGEAFGDFNPDGLVSVPRGELPQIGPEHEGEYIEVRVEDDDEGELGAMEMRVERVEAEAVILDANHPLAGRPVAFELHVLAVEPPA